MIGTAVYQQLKNTAAVTALCRWIYPHVIPEDRDVPAITYRVETDDRRRVLDGEATYKTARVALDVYTDKYLDSQTLANAIQSALTDYRGTLGDTITVDADHIRLDRRYDLHEAATGRYRVHMMFFVGYE